MGESNTVVSIGTYNSIALIHRYVVISQNMFNPLPHNPVFNDPEKEGF